MKRFHAAARGLPLFLCLTLAACGGDETPSDGNGTNTDGGTPGGGTPDAGGGGGGGNTSLPMDSSGASCNNYTKGSGNALADLTFDRLNARASYDSATTTLSMDFTVANIGPVDTGPFKAVIYLYPDSNNACSGYPLYTYNFLQGAAPNGQGTIRFSQNLSQFAAKDKPPAGTYTVGFVLDSGNAVTESDEGNNGRLFNVQVKL